MKFFQSLEKSRWSKKASMLSIGRYEKKYYINKKNLDKAKRESEEKIKDIFPFDLPNIKKELAEYKNNQNEQDDWLEKTEKYIRARGLLDLLLVTKINNHKEFLEYYETLVGPPQKESLWHSGSLFRLRNSVAKKYGIFLDMLREVQKNLELPPDKLFEIGMKYVEKVRGLGVNVLTEIMNTYKPEKFAVLNNNPVESLKHIGLAEKFPPTNNFSPRDYAKFVQLWVKLHI